MMADATPPNTAEAGVEKKHTVFSAALWSVALRWTNRLMGFVSTLVLVRVLSPGDFGVMAMAMLVIGLLEVMMDFGVITWLMQKKDAKEEDYHLAWSVRLLQSIGFGLAIAVAAPFAGRYFGDDRVVPVMLALALFSAFGGLENIGPVAWQKALDFRTPFKLFLYRRIATSVTTIGASLYFQSYWGLVAGMFVSALVGTVLSYTMCAFRPRWRIEGAGGLLSSSIWLIAYSLGGYLNGKVDAFLLGRMGGPTAVGFYSIAQEISSMPTSELLGPMSRALLPGLVEVKDRPNGLRWAYLLASGVQVTLAMPMAVGIAMTSHLIVPVFLGAQWLPAADVLALLALAAGFSTFAYSSAYVNLAFGRFRLVAVMSVASIFAFLSIGVAFLDIRDPVQVALGRCIVAAATNVCLILSLSIWFNVASLRDVLNVYVRPTVATFLMVLAVKFTDHVLVGPLELKLAVEVAVGASTFSATLLVLWMLSGKPFGAESYILSKMHLLKGPFKAPLH